MNKILLDTNAYSNLLSGDEKVLNELSLAATVHMSVIVIGELLYGFRNGSKFKWNKDILDKFLSKSTVKVLDIQSETASIYSNIYLSLKKKGNQIPINDVWIASQAIETGSVLITFDKHFKKSSGTANLG